MVIDDYDGNGHDDDNGENNDDENDYYDGDDDACWNNFESGGSKTCEQQIGI